jgi:hypothetical protein
MDSNILFMCKCYLFRCNILIFWFFNTPNGGFLRLGHHNWKKSIKHPNMKFVKFLKKIPHTLYLGMY